MVMPILKCIKYSDFGENCHNLYSYAFPNKIIGYICVDGVEYINVL